MSTVKDNTLPEENHGFDYDLVVIGGGSGGISCARASSELGKSVALLDFVKPSLQGTSWGLGGTCVNVGCIPKKLMHRAAILGEDMEDAKAFGWTFNDKKHEWATMVQAVQDHIGSLNFGYRVDMRSKGVKYINAYGSFKDPHTLETVDRKGQTTLITARRFVVAVGGRPFLPDDVVGAKEYALTSDDIFSLSTPPGKTLVVGASYVALECAGFLAGLGYDTTVMIRSIPLRGFDQQMAEMIVDYMANHHTKFIRNAIPSKIEKRESDGKLLVTYSRQMGETHLGETVEEYDTVLFATGRRPVTDIGLKSVGVAMARSGKIQVNEYEQTSVPHIYAVGDCVEGKPELTPVAIQAGNLLAHRLFGSKTEAMDYAKVPTTVFTPLEYGSCGLSEEEAVAKYGEENIEVYHSHFKPLEWTVPHREDNACYIKVIVNKLDDERVLGFHILSPNAGEVTQGVALGMKLGARKRDLDETVGIHPTVGEEFTTLHVTKSSGADPLKTGC